MTQALGFPLTALRTRRIFITGAAGAGSTTLGRALATALAVPHHDTDDYLWLPSAPPYQDWRPREDRLRLMREIFLPRSDWVLSGGVQGWGEEIVCFFDLVVFLRTATEVRVERLRSREARTFGSEAIGPGGWREKEFSEFIEWAAQYDAGTVEERNLARQLSWLDTLQTPVLRLDGARPSSDLVAVVMETLPQRL